MADVASPSLPQPLRGTTAPRHGEQGGQRPRLLALLLPGLLLACALLLLPLQAAWAVSTADLPATPPSGQVLDQADVLSRAARTDIDHQLESFGRDHIDARLVTVNRLDYGLSLDTLGQQLLTRWDTASSTPLLLLLLDTQTRATAVVAAPELAGQLPAELLESTARTTFAQPLRQGDRYRQAVLDALDRLAVVLDGGEDPGEPVEPELVTPVSNVPTREETAGSNAFTWVVVLLVVGSVVPMLTWWVFSR